jgi:mannose-6-phosphate isomerase-like protein (cupin superfamily)
LNLISRSDSHQIHSGFAVSEPGKEVGEHTTEEGEELIVMIEGKAEIMSGGHAEEFESPCVVLVPAYTIHNVKNTAKAPLKYVYVVVAAERPADN